MWHNLEFRPFFRNMEDTDAIVVACSTALIVWSLGAMTMLAAKKKRKHSTWVKQYIKQDMMRSTMLQEMKANDMSWYVQ